MAKAKTKNSTEKLPNFRRSKLQRLGREFRALEPKYMEAERKRSKLFRLFQAGLKKAERGMGERDPAAPGFASFEKIRNSRIDEIGRQTGYYNAHVPYERYDRLLYRLSQKIVSLTPKTYQDLEIQVKAYSFLAYDTVEDRHNEKQSFLLRFAKFTGTKLIIH